MTTTTTTVNVEIDTDHLGTKLLELLVTGPADLCDAARAEILDGCSEHLWFVSDATLGDFKIESSVERLTATIKDHHS